MDNETIDISPLLSEYESRLDKVKSEIIQKKNKLEEFKKLEDSAKDELMKKNLELKKAHAKIYQVEQELSERIETIKDVEKELKVTKRDVLREFSVQTKPSNFRVIVRKTGDSVIMFNNAGNPIQRMFPSLVKELSELNLDNFVLSGYLEDKSSIVGLAYQGEEICHGVKLFIDNIPFHNKKVENFEDKLRLLKEVKTNEMIGVLMPDVICNNDEFTDLFSKAEKGHYIITDIKTGRKQFYLHQEQVKIVQS